MELNNQDQARIREYLLGKLSDAEEHQIEERLMIEEALFEELEISKGELIEDYLAGELTEHERQWLEQHFLASSEGKQRHTFAVALEGLNRPSPRPQKLTLSERIYSYIVGSPVMLAKQATVVLLLIAAGIFIIPRLLQQPTFVPLNLTGTNLSRSGGVLPVKLLLPSNVDEVRVSLALPNSAAANVDYSAELDDTNEIKTLSISSHNSQSVFLVIPASQLHQGQYALKLFAIMPDRQKQLVTTYFFDVE